MPLRRLQTNFTGGEINPELIGRSDTALYQNGAALCRNVRTLAGGGLRRRSGLVHCATVRTDPGGGYQHVEWIFNADQTYQMVFSQTRVDIFEGVNGGLLQTITGCPWGGSEMRRLSVYCQGDFAFICHPDLHPMQLKRIAAASFVLEQFRFDTAVAGEESPVWQPYHRFLPSNEPIRVEAISGYTTSGWVPGAVANLHTFLDYFHSGYIGVRLQICGAQWEVYSISGPRSALAVLRSPNFRVPLVENAFTIIQGTSEVIVYDFAHDFPVGGDVVVANATPFATLLYQNINGVREVTAINGANWIYQSGAAVANATEVGGGPDAIYWSNDVRTLDWQEQMYSVVRGWPHCVSGFQQRLILGGGRSSPNRINFSRTEAPFNFDPGTGADNDAILIGVSGRKTPTVQSIIGSSNVQIFTSEGEYYVPHTEDAAALTPTTIAVLPQTFYGTRAGTVPVEFDGATLFISRNGNHLRQLTWGEKGYTAADLSLVAKHMTSTPVWLAVQMEDADQGAATALIVNDAGGVAALTMMRSEKVAAWAYNTTQGLFQSACAVNSRAFFVVRRTIAGVLSYNLEKLDRGHLLDGSIMGFSRGKHGQLWTWDGFSHYTGQPVRVIVDGRSDIGVYTPDGAGQIYIPVNAATVEVGFGFSPIVRTLPPEIALPDGPSQGEPRRVVAAHLKVRDTIGMKVRRTKVLNTTAESDLGIAAPLYSGGVHVHMLGWDDLGQVDITQSSNGPFTLLSANLDLEF